MNPNDPNPAPESSPTDPDGRISTGWKNPKGPEKGSPLSSKLGSGCLVLFGLPFLAAGLFVMSLAVKSYMAPGSVPVHSSSGDLGPVGQVVFLGIFGAVFALAGLGVMAAGIWAGRKSRVETTLREAHRDEPWKSKESWASGVIRPSAQGQAFGLLFFALVWNGVSFPMAIFVFPREWEKGNHAVLLVLLFPAVGLLVAWAAVQGLLQWARFRRVVLRMEIPGVLGGRVRGQIDTGTPLPVGAGVDLRLTCAHKKWVGSGKSRHVDETILWQESQTIAAERIAPGLSGSLVPVEFKTPYRLPASSVGATDEWDEWRLDAKASIAGPDFDVSFDVPVFRTRESHDDGLEVGDGEVPVEKAEVHAPGPESRIVISMTPTGEREIVLLPNRTRTGPGAGLSCSVIALGLIAGGVAVFRFEGPLPAAAILVLLGLAGFALIGELLFGQRRIAVGSDGITMRGMFLRMGSRVIPKSDIEKVAVRISKTQQPSKEAAKYDVAVALRSAPSAAPWSTIADEFRDKGEAEWVAEEIRKGLGIG